MGDGVGRRRQRVALVTIGVVLAVAAIAPTAPAEESAAPAAPSSPPPGTIVDRRAVPEDRYALAGGCYAVRSLATDRYLVRTGTGGFEATAADVVDAEPFHFRATDLGRYLLYGSAADYLTVGGRATASPGPAADWILDDAGDGSFRLRMAPDDELAAGPDGALTMASGPTADVNAGFDFLGVDGCAAFPEVELNVSGPHLTGATPYEEVTGYNDAHLHVMAYEFLGGMVHCGRPWDPYGVTRALVDCPDHQVAEGAGAVLENFLSSRGVPLGTHDPVGWPTFADWPAPGSLTHEQVYYRWLERAWRGGLRTMVNLFTDNRALCEIYPLKKNSCDEMDSVRLQAQRTRELERYIDAQSGGPGKGWFRIVDDPFEARRVANEGKLAVVLGIEISEPFGCRSFIGVAQCDEGDVDARLDELDALGIRQLVVIHKFDNALGGVAGDGGTTGVVVNLGNFDSTGRFWDFETCDPDDTGVHDNDQGLPTPELTSTSNLFGAVLSQFGLGGTLPVYPPPHHCNTMGLSPLGAHAVQAMIDRGMIVDVDHMSVRARQQALDILEANGYSGVISSHSWATPDAYPRVYALGGFTAPYAGNSTGFADAWRERRAVADERYVFGLGYGADANGLGAQGAARGGGVENPVVYPFEGLGGVVVDRQVSGSRVFDVNTDGVAHYGLYPDWIEDLRQIAGDAIVGDLARGSEAYLQMWERAAGVPGPGCRGAEAFGALRPGMAPEEVLRVAGPPDARRGSSFRYCDLTLDFDADGRLAGARGPAVAVAAGSAGAGARLLAGLPATGADRPLAPVAAGSLLLAAVAALWFVRTARATGSLPSHSTAATGPSRRTSRSPHR